MHALLCANEDVIDLCMYMHTNDSRFWHFFTVNIHTIKSHEIVAQVHLIQIFTRQFVYILLLSSYRQLNRFVVLIACDKSWSAKKKIIKWIKDGRQAF